MSFRYCRRSAIFYQLQFASLRNLKIHMVEPVKRFRLKRALNKLSYYIIIRYENIE